MELLKKRKNEQSKEIEEILQNMKKNEEKKRKLVQTEKDLISNEH